MILPLLIKSTDQDGFTSRLSILLFFELETFYFILGYIQPVHSKGNQSSIFTGRTNAEAETPILWPPDAKSWLIWKDPDARKDGSREEKGTIEDEMVGWHYQLNGHKFEYAPGVGDGQGSLACYNPWGHKESDTPERLNWTELTADLQCCGSLWWTLKAFSHIYTGLSILFHSSTCLSFTKFTIFDNMPLG